MTETTDPVDAGVDVCSTGGATDGATDGATVCPPVTPGLVRCDAALTNVFEILGKRWNGIIIGALTQGPASFSQLG
ncbi:MAG: hypothetical protein ACRYG2_12660, partial [Janthinobacterium lividum]